MIRNIQEVRRKVVNAHIQQQLQPLLLQYGLDDLLWGLKFTYRDLVQRRDDVPAVSKRLAVLNETCSRLKSIQDQEMEVSA